MSETQRIVALARRARARGEQLCLATVVRVEGSAYRKPGARMLVTSSGERVGTISGGCLESEVSRKIWWLTANGSRIERYASFADEDGGTPYGLGCGGAVSLLLEQGEPALAVLDALGRVLTARQPAVVITALGLDATEDRQLGTVAVLALRDGIGRSAIDVHHRKPGRCALGRNAGPVLGAAEAVFAQQRSVWLDGELAEIPSRRQEAEPAYFLEYLAPPPAITIFGAGDDAQPIVELAHTLGWRVTVADGRAHLARRERFSLADEVRVLDYADPALRSVCGMARDDAPGSALSSTGLAESAGLPCDDLAVILTHSFEQDRALLTALLPRKLRYLGILGPRHRTGRLIEDVAPAIGLSVAECFARLHSPVGLDLGAGDPAAVALSIVAEIQAGLHDRQVQVSRILPDEPVAAVPEDQIA